MSKKNIFPIDASQILFFARSINEENPIYYDAEYAKSKGLQGTIAPLTFVEAYHQFDSTYRLRPNPDKKWPGTPRQKITESKKNDNQKKKSQSKGGTGLHAEQHFEYHMPVYSGDVLHWEDGELKSWEREGKKGGKLIFTEYSTQFFNQNDELVVTARKVTVVTEKVVKEEDGKK